MKTPLKLVAILAVVAPMTYFVTLQGEAESQGLPASNWCTERHGAQVCAYELSDGSLCLIRSDDVESGLGCY